MLAREYKNDINFSITIQELKIFIGILIFSGYHELPSERHYWSEFDDLRIHVVKNAISRDRFQKIKSYIHFADNSKAILQIIQKLMSIKMIKALKLDH